MYKFKISNIDCANCCDKLERKLNKNKDMKVTINFMTQILTIDTNLEIELVKEYLDKILGKKYTYEKYN